jgi:hypothetical protein
MAAAASGAMVLSSELAFLLEREGVVTNFKDKLIEFGVNTIPKFAALVDSQAEMRDLLKSDFEMDSKAGNMEMKSKVSSILVAWSTAKKRADKQAELDGELDARNEPKKIPVGDHMAMKTTFENKYWRLEDELSPGKAYLEKKLEMVEKDDLKAELLTEVLCVRDDGEDTLKPIWDSSMNLKAVKVGTKVPLPVNAEQLRRRLSIMGAAWYFVASSHSSRSYLREMEVHVWTEYANYLLGKFVLGILGGEDGAPVGSADWEVILTYEQEIRREMVVRMQAGTPLGTALRGAWSDPIVKDRYLVSALQRRTLRARRGGEDALPPPKRPRGQPKDTKGKGKGKKQEKKDSLRTTAGCAGATPDGNKICYAFNNRGEGCARKNCPFAHVCGVCFRQKTPMFDCKHDGGSKH